MSSKWLVIIFLILGIVGAILLFVIIPVFIFSLTVDTIFALFITGSTLVIIGFLGFFISLLYWIFAGRKKVGA